MDEDEIECCIYHKVLYRLSGELLEKLIDNYDSPYFEYWLGMDSLFADTFEEVFQTALGVPLLDTQEELLRVKGLNLENKIDTWFKTYKDAHPELENAKLPFTYLTIKLYEYLVRHFQKNDIRSIIGQPC